MPSNPADVTQDTIADWPLNDFPHPNPLFPAPPRAFTGVDRWWQLFCKFGWLVTPVLGAAILVLYSRGVLGFETGSQVLVGMAGVGLIVTGPLFGLLGLARFRQWARGRIVPALVIRSRPPKALHPALKYPLGIAAGLAGAGDMLREAEAVGVYNVRYAIADDVWEERLRIIRPHDPIDTGDIIWVVTLKKGGHAQALQQCAPAKYAAVRVPDEIAYRVRPLLQASDPAQLKAAAKAATRAFNEATRYNRRSGGGA